MSRSICPVLMVMSALFAQWLPAEAQDARPNILFIVMDGHPWAKDPAQF
jgi:hypothetical protein